MQINLDNISTLAAQFKINDFVHVPAVISPELCELLANYVHLKANAKPNIRRGGDSLANVHREYADPMLEVLLTHYQPIIEAATGLDLWPTLSFSYHYVHGNQLLPHRDRASCEIVAGLCLGADPLYKQTQTDWPLLIKDKPKITLNYGDILIFRGQQLEHWREVFTGEWFVSAILAYVDKQGKFAYQKFDQRKNLGAQHVGMFKWSWGVLKNRLKQMVFVRR